MVVWVRELKVQRDQRVRDVAFLAVMKNTEIWGSTITAVVVECLEALEAAQLSGNLTSHLYSSIHPGHLLMSFLWSGTCVSFSLFSSPVQTLCLELTETFGLNLVVQWLRIHLPVQETQVSSLVWEDSICPEATKAMGHNYWNQALEPANFS